MMKRTAFILTSLLVLSFGLAHGQSVGVSVNTYAPDTIGTSMPIIIEISFDLTGMGVNVGGNSNGLKFHDNGSGSQWDPPDSTTGTGNAFYTGAITSGMYDGGTLTNLFSADGMGADTVGLAGFALFGTGIPAGFNEVVFTFTTQFDNTEDGLEFCIDSAFFPPGGPWTWGLVGGGSVSPAWTASCYTIYLIPNLPPVMTNCGDYPDADHCVLASRQYTADDPEGDAFTFTQNGGPGTTTSAGMWSYAPTAADVGVTYTIEMTACDQFGCQTQNPCSDDITFTNEAPVFTGGCGDLVFIGKGNSGSIQMSADPVDCDPITYVICSAPTVDGSISIDPNTGLLTFNTTVNDVGLWTVSVGVTDGIETVCCDVQFDVLAVEPFQIVIEKTHNTIQGGHEMVDVSQEAGSEVPGGFDFLIAYDQSALTFVAALEGDIYAKCGWEYFTYRYGASGNCGGGCPSGLLRVVGIAETNNGNHNPVPDCTLDPGETFFSLDFLVTDDRTLECQYVPIRFFWLDCGDNTISSQSGDSLFISRFVYDFGLVGDITNPSSGYPTFTGAQDADCFTGDENKAPVRFIDFFNGGIDIVCADSIDARGDINLNDVAYEIADAVVFSNYFVYGLGAFNQNVQGQIAASDVNADGLALSVADLVYLIRVVIGDALPYPKLSPVASTYTVDNGIVSVNSQMGAAALVIAGNAVPTLLADNMEMRYNFDGTHTRILVYSMEAGASFSGDFINVQGNVVSLEMATYEGAPVTAKVIPASFALKQNYPNPFNPMTNIRFDMPKAGAYELYIYNVTGQKVSEFVGQAEAGEVTITWDASGMASGIYFYKLNTENFNDTKKMVLLK